MWQTLRWWWVEKSLYWFGMIKSKFAIFFCYVLFVLWWFKTVMGNLRLITFDDNTARLRTLTTIFYFILFVSMLIFFSLLLRINIPAAIKCLRASIKVNISFFSLVERMVMTRQKNFITSLWAEVLWWHLPALLSHFSKPSIFSFDSSANFQIRSGYLGKQRYGLISTFRMKMVRFFLFSLFAIGDDETSVAPDIIIIDDNDIFKLQTNLIPIATKQFKTHFEFISKCFFRWKAYNQKLLCYEVV